MKFKIKKENLDFHQFEKHRFKVLNISKLLARMWQHLAIL